MRGIKILEESCILALEKGRVFSFLFFIFKKIKICQKVVMILKNDLKKLQNLNRLQKFSNRVPICNYAICESQLGLMG